MAILSVILPVLNGMPYLTDALQSLENQTFRDFELFLWDNGSTDGSLEEAMLWIPERLPGKIFSDKTLPLHECLSSLVELTRTTFIARMDADDISLPRRFELQLKELTSNPQLGVVGGQCPMIDERGLRLGISHPGPLKHEDIVTEMIFRSALTHPALMFRREAVLVAGNYTRPKPVEDLDLYLRISGLFHFSNLQDEVLLYRIHSRSICQSDLLGQQQEVISVVSTHCLRVYGLKPDLYRSLRRRRYFCSAIPMMRSAFFRSDGDLIQAWRIVSSDSFLFISRCFTREGDIISKTLYRIIEALRQILPE